MEEASLEHGEECMQDLCWPLVAGYLCARDLLSLSLASASIRTSLGATQGLWQQAAAALHAGSSTSRPSSAAADERARLLLRAATALAHRVSRAPSVPPQPLHIPPWLPGQPGRARSFSRVDAGRLQPPLELSAAQLHLLALGGLCGQQHTSGVFTSACSASPRSQAPCARQAVVVVDKALVAELYVPCSASLADHHPWAGILHPASRQGALFGCGSGAGGGRASGSGGSSSSSSSSSSAQQPAGRHAPAAAAAAATAATAAGAAPGGAAALGGAACSFELWLSAAVSLQPPDPAGAESRRGPGGQPGRRRGAASSTPAKPPGVTWSHVHALIMQCIDDNVGRCRAVLGTTVVAPGTTAAVDMEQQLAQLAAGGAPVLDLRRLRYSLSAGELQAAAAAAAAAPRQQRDKGAATARNSNGRIEPQQQQPLAQPQPQEQEQQQPLLAAAQAALTAALLAKLRAGDAPACLEDDDCKAEVLGSVVSQLPRLAPDLQVLVLPVLLPGGRAARRLPGSGKLSAPRLLCLNAPALMAVRHAWEQLARLRQVLLMVGPPSPPASAAPSEPPSAQGPLVRGTYTVQQLEQQLQQQAQLRPGWKQEGQEGAGAAEQLDELGGGSGGSQATVPLPPAAVEALQDMVLSCMDRTL